MSWIGSGPVGEFRKPDRRNRRGRPDRPDSARSGAEADGHGGAEAVEFTLDRVEPAGARGEVGEDRLVL